MTNYTLIAHKPDSTDYCRGCLMESYSGDFEMEYSRSLEDLAQLWKRCAHKDMSRGRGESRYDMTLLINGVPLGNIEPTVDWISDGDDPALVPLGIEARVWLERLEAEVAAEAGEQRRAAEAAEVASKRATARAQEDRERAQYLTLHAKFGAHHA